MNDPAETPANQGIRLQALAALVLRLGALWSVVQFGFHSGVESWLHAGAGSKAMAVFWFGGVALGLALFWWVAGWLAALAVPRGNDTIILRNCDATVVARIALIVVGILLLVGGLASSVWYQLAWGGEFAAPVTTRLEPRATTISKALAMLIGAALVALNRRLARLFLRP